MKTARSRTGRWALYSFRLPYRSHHEFGNDQGITVQGFQGHGGALEYIIVTLSVCHGCQVLEGRNDGQLVSAQFGKLARQSPPSSESLASSEV